MIEQTKGNVFVCVCVSVCVCVCCVHITGKHILSDVKHEICICSNRLNQKCCGTKENTCIYEAFEGVDIVAIITIDL